MQPREKVLAAVVAVLAVLAGVWFIGRGVLSGFTERNGRIAVLEKDVAAKKGRIAAGEVAAEKLDDFRRRSLPDDPHLSRSLYQNWLLALVDRTKLKNGDVKPINAPASRGSFQVLRFTVRGHGTLQQIVDFLHGFYSQDYLHQAQLISLKRLEGADQIDMTVSVEVAIVPGAQKRQKLAEAPSQRLALQKVEDYRDAIVKRNVYAAYVPPRPGPTARRDAPPPPPFDDARQAFVTAIVDDGEAPPQAWVNVRTSGRRLLLHEGEDFTIGSMKGTITRIGPQEVEILADGKRRLVALGTAIHEGRELAPDGG